MLGRVTVTCLASRMIGVHVPAHTCIYTVYKLILGRTCLLGGICVEVRAQRWNPVFYLYVFQGLDTARQAWASSAFNSEPLTAHQSVPVAVNAHTEQYTGCPPLTRLFTHSLVHSLSGCLGSHCSVLNTSKAEILWHKEDKLKPCLPCQWCL